MFRVKSSVVLVVVLGLGLVLTGCAKPPVEAIEKARTGLTSLDAVEASVYAPDALAKARQAIEAVDAEVAVQEAKFALVRSYEKTNQLIAAAEQEAQAANAEAVAGKERARAAAETAIAGLQTSLDQARTLLTELAACPRKPKGFKEDMELLQGSMAALELLLPEAQQALSADRLFDAEAKATAAQSQVATLITDLEGAKTKIKC